MNFKKILLPFILFSSIFFWHSSVFAQNVTVAQDTTLAVGGYNYTLLSTSNALDQLEVDATSFTITTTLSNGTVTIRSSDRINLGIPYNNSGIAVTTCNTGESVFVIQALTSSARVVKVTPPASTAGDFLCNVATAAGSGGGGSSPSPAPTSTPAPASTSATVEEPEKLEFKDVPGSGKKKVTKKSADAIMRVALLMTEKGSYKWPTNKKFYPHNPMPILTALQMSLAVSGNGCEGKTPSGKNCLNAAIAAGIVDQKESAILPKKPSRVLYYEMLLNAAKIPLLTKEEITDDYLCKDVKASSRDAPVVATARAYGIASVYKGKKCNAKKIFKKWEAVIFASRTLDAMEALKKQADETVSETTAEPAQ